MMNKGKNRAAKALIGVTNKMINVAANSRCALIYHQPKQPETLKKFRKF
jgi:cyclic lactone autoinducer peptide